MPRSRLTAELAALLEQTDRGTTEDRARRAARQQTDQPQMTAATVTKTSDGPTLH